MPLMLWAPADNVETMTNHGIYSHWINDLLVALPDQEVFKRGVNREGLSFVSNLLLKTSE